MAPPKIRTAKRFAQWEEKPAEDYDIENDAPEKGNGSDSEEDSVDEGTGTEHYVSVGKSKLRQKDSINLGPEYRGTRVSRAALQETSDEDYDDEEEGEDEEESGSEEDGDFADPDAVDLEADQLDDDAEIDSDEAFGESDAEKFKAKGFVFRGSSKPEEPKTKDQPKTNGHRANRPTAADFMPTSSDEEEGSEEGSEEEESDGADFSGDESENGALVLDEAEVSGDDDEEDDEEDEDDDNEDDEEEEEEEDDESDNDGDDQRAQLRKIMSEGQKSVLATMSQAAKADAEKGVAVRVQRRAFDSILNLRIRLQKALVAANSFNVVERSEEPAGSKEPYAAAEEAAIKLWNTIDSVRSSMHPEIQAKAGAKRKRDAATMETSSQDMWESMKAAEKPVLAHRRKVLDKWSSRVRGTTVVATRRLGQNKDQSLVSVLDDQLLSADRLIKRARTPRSCAPAQVAKKVGEDPEIYDDADFYQLLLKELVDQRSTDSAAPGESVATVRWAALKEAKTRKQVDRKASKGRKIRYTVHEKLQNFMAPEDRRSWEEQAIDRFFGTLFGQKMELKEDEEDEEDTEMGGANVEEAGLKLFRS
ncbi:hypothetical protein QBC46DRAFT_371236 [Diplogelasinospora grovesii]|uniref:Protein BFR2 n=1 Tax=Diplogelasinospora grovesii TaxID=303347 RepID=A0AAN6NHI7_9PEZI|nr:hypothetical protein QBC46DRAFT_371236 [Diplogelasinospora grovesii]